MTYKQIGKTMPTTIKKRFKVWLIKNNINQSQFALKCGFSRQYISAILNQKLYLTPKIVKTFESRDL